MPMLTPHRNQSPNSQRKSINWFQNVKSIEMKKANNNEISKPACFYLSKSAEQLQRKACSEVIMVSLNK